jgi:hypothetical protein
MVYSPIQPPCLLVDPGDLCTERAGGIYWIDVDSYKFGLGLSDSRG